MSVSTLMSMSPILASSRRRFTQKLMIDKIVSQNSFRIGPQAGILHVSSSDFTNRSTAFAWVMFKGQLLKLPKLKLLASDGASCVLFGTEISHMRR
ncbi:MAG TPA: hypothetical protein VK446_06400 [Methylocystis sp.]|nr:hypothetical protein [Methylocystis sp.]